MARKQPQEAPLHLGKPTPPPPPPPPKRCECCCATHIAALQAEVEREREKRFNVSGIALAFLLEITRDEPDRTWPESMRKLERAALDAAGDRER